MCQFLNVSRSCFYDGLKRPKTEREKENEELIDHLKTLFLEGRETYGTLRLKRKLEDLGYTVSRRRVGRLMKRAGLICNSSVTSSIRFDVTIQALNSFFRCVTSTNGRKSYHPLIALRFKIAHWCS